MTPVQAEAELASLVASWGERVGASGHVFTPGEHVMQMEPLQDEIVGSARRVLWMLQAAVATRAAHRLRQSRQPPAGARRGPAARARGAHGAGREPGAAAPPVHGGRHRAVAARRGARPWPGLGGRARAEPSPIQTVFRVSPTLPWIRQCSGSPCSCPSLTGVAFGLVPLLQVSAAGLGRLLKDAGTRGATSARRVRGALVAGEVALAVVLVVGAGLMVRTVREPDERRRGIRPIAAGDVRRGAPGCHVLDVRSASAGLSAFDRSIRRHAGRRARVDRCPGSRRSVRPTASGQMSKTIRRGQTCWTWWTTTRRSPPAISKRCEFRSCEAAHSSEADRIGAPVAVVNETFARTFWKDLDPIGRRVRPRFGDETPWVTVVGVAKDVKQGGVDRATGTELYFLLEQLPQVFPTVPALNSILRSITDSGAMNIVLRSGLPMATLQPAIAERRA